MNINATRIGQWNSDELPIYEAGLDRIVRTARGKNLFFSTEIEKGIKEAEIIFVSVNTPTKTFGAGAGMAADLQHWYVRGQVDCPWIGCGSAKKPETR